MVIEELKAKAGFGGAKVEIRIPKDKYRLDETIKGDVLLFGGKVAQEITVINISLIRNWSWECYTAGRDLDCWGDGRGAQSTYSVSDKSEYELDGDKGSDTILNLELAKNIEIEPEEKQVFSFSMDLSTIENKQGINEKWELRARAEIPFAKDAISDQVIEVVKSN